MNKKYRKVIIAGNWKMNMLPSEVKAYADALREKMPRHKTCETVLCVPFTHLHALKKALKDTRIAIGAQDISSHEKGAFTGEVSGSMLKDLGARYVIIGHSERRQYHGEDEALICEKAEMALKNALTPIICVGESLEQRERGLWREFVGYQTAAILGGIGEARVRSLVFAYEPIWAIGTGKTAEPEQAQEVCAEIRRVIRERCGARVARSVCILYGGSMNVKNAKELLSMPDIDGGLIGGASLKSEELAGIIDAVAQADAEAEG